MRQCYVLVACALLSLLQPLAGSSSDPGDSFHLISNYQDDYNIRQSRECSEVLQKFANSASNFTLCSIQNARPIHMCERCVTQYVDFRDKYEEALNKTVNGTSCKSVLISNDKLEVMLMFHNNILSVWNEAKCSLCYNWTNNLPTLSEKTINFYKLYNTTKKCINSNIQPGLNNSEEVCKLCMDSYIELDDFYQSLGGNAVDNVCMDIIDSMNATRFVWSGILKCCSLRRHPEIIFLSCTALISAMPILFYLILRFCTPIRDLPPVLKQTRFKQTFLAAQPRRQQTIQ